MTPRLSARSATEATAGQDSPRCGSAKATRNAPAQLSYQDSWGEILQRHRQWRCHLCIDHTGEFADVSVGDPWYRDIEPGDPGRSLVIARTPRGRAAVEAAIESGMLMLSPVDPALLPASQPNLLAARGAVWGRIVTCRAMLVAAPRYRQMPTFGAWRRLRLKAKLQSFYGTAKRLFRSRPLSPSRHREGDAPRFPLIGPVTSHSHASPELCRRLGWSPLCVAVAFVVGGGAVGGHVVGG